MVDLYKGEIKEKMQLVSRANHVADSISRDLLIHMLPDELFHRSHLLRPDPKAKKNLLNQVASGIAYISDIFKFTQDWSEREDERRQREKKFEDSVKARIKNARNLIHVLNFESLIPYYLDYKRKGLNYAYSKWSQTIPREPLRVRVANKNSENKVFHINLRKVEDETENQEE